MSTHATRLDNLLLSRHIRRGDMPGVRPVGKQWSFRALEGRLVELIGASAPATLTAAMGIVREAQQGGDNVAWLSRSHTLFFPPDAALMGVDLNALVIVRLHNAADLYLAADYLLRSNGFGLVVLDPGADEPSNLDARQSRLSGLARKHHAAALILRRRHNGAMTSLCAQAERRKEIGPDRLPRWRIAVTPLRDRHSAASWCHEEVCHGPDGMY